MMQIERVVNIFKSRSVVIQRNTKSTFDYGTFLKNQIRFFILQIQNLMFKAKWILCTISSMSISSCKLLSFRLKLTSYQILENFDRVFT